MTGIKVKILRDGKWPELDVDTLTDDELGRLVAMERRQGRDGWGLVRQLAAWIRDRPAAGEGDARA